MPDEEGDEPVHDEVGFTVDGFDGAPDASPDGALSVGFDRLDRWLGGLPLGSLVALVADPDSPSEELLYPMADANPARYLSLLRTAPEVDRHATTNGFPGFEATETTSASLLDDPAGLLSGLDPESLVVVDPATELEREGRERYRQFLETLKRAVETTDSVGVLHCPRMNPRALQRDLTLARVDTVLELEGYRGSSGTQPPETRWALGVRKSRFGRLPENAWWVDFTNGPNPVQIRDLS